MQDAYKAFLKLDAKALLKWDTQPQLAMNVISTQGKKWPYGHRNHTTECYDHAKVSIKKGALSINWGTLLRNKELHMSILSTQALLYTDYIRLSFCA